MSIAADARGAAYVAVVTQSSDFPLTPGGGIAAAGANAAFVAKLAPDGSFLHYSARIGHSPLPYPVKVAVTNLTEAAVLLSGTDIVKVNAAGTRVVWHAEAPAGGQYDALASDAQGAIWAVGTGFLSGAATANAAQPLPACSAWFHSDDGETWSIGRSLDVDTVWQFAGAAGGIYAATSAGLYVSADRGANWTRLLEGGVVRVAFDPGAPGTIYASRLAGRSAYFFPGSPAGFSCVFSRKFPRMPEARPIAPSPNLSRRRSAAASVCFHFWC